MNLVLSKDIKRELLSGEECERIREAVLKVKNGEIEIFVRGGRIQRTAPPPTNILFDENLGLHIKAYESLVEQCSIKIRDYEREIDFGYLIITYTAGDNGDLLTFDIQLKEEFVHKKKKPDKK